jgi:hypothetical protein
LGGLDGAKNRVDTLAERRRRVHARNVLRYAQMRIDGEDFVYELVLTEIDLGARDGWQDRFEDRPRAGVVPGEEGPRRAPEVLGHIGRVGMADETGRFGECLRVRDDPWRWT